MTRRDRPPRRARGDEGAVLVEFALFAPVAVLLLMGVLEFGLAFKDANTMRSATRAAGRAGSNTFVGGGNSDLADFNILTSLKAGMAGIDLDTVVRVVVYRANGADGAIPASCETYNPPSGYGSPGGQPCNVYTGAFLDALPATGASWSTAYDTGWDPLTRDVDASDGDSTDYLGIWIQVDRDAVTGFFGSTITMRDRTVMSLEPDFS